MTPKSTDEAVNRAVTRDELREALNRSIPPDERDDVAALVRWFTGRYGTAEARLAYVRQALRRWRPGV